jgi:ribonuclease HI
MGTDKMLPRHVFHKPFTVRFPDRSEWERGSIPIKKGRLICYPDGFKTNEGTEAGVCGHGMKQKFSFSLGQYTTVFQVEVYAIKACAVENIKRGYLKRNIYILSDSQAAIKELDTYKINSKLVWDCHQYLMVLAEHNNVQFIGVPGYKASEGIETADQLAKRDVNMYI